MEDEEELNEKLSTIWMEITDYKEPPSKKTRCVFIERREEEVHDDVTDSTKLNLILDAFPPNSL